ncbi:MAG: phage head closure protein [Pseudomonadota bacterium]
MTPSIGELRRRLVIEAASDVADGGGGYARTWSALATVFGRIEPRRRRESVDDGRVVGLVTHRITIRWRDDVTGDHRFVADGTVYRVLAVEAHDERRRFLSCLCEEERQ